VDAAGRFDPVSALRMSLRIGIWGRDVPEFRSAGAIAIRFELYRQYAQHCNAPQSHGGALG
jgi:hypothetical protein